MWKLTICLPGYCLSSKEPVVLLQLGIQFDVWNNPYSGYISAAKIDLFILSIIQKKKKMDTLNTW